MNDKKVQIILIEDDPKDLRLIEASLNEAENFQFALECVSNLSDGLKRLGEDKFDVLLLDLSLPDNQGLGAILKTQRSAPQVPIIVLTQTDDRTLGLKLMGMGVQDYLVKTDLDSHLLIRSISYAIERKKAEERLRESEARLRSLSESLEEIIDRKVDQLKQFESLAAIGKIISTLAQEIRNPLRSINIGVVDMKELMGQDEEKQQILEEISYGVSLLNNLVSELLEFSKATTLSYSSLPVQSIINRALKEVSPELRGINVHMHLEQGDTEISADIAKIVTLLANLISNAADAMPKGGNIMIRSSIVKRNGRNHVKISISDSGSGISSEDLAQIQKPFFTTKTQGTGLGIPYARKIIEAHNGSLCIESKIDEGTTVEIMLPVSNPR